ncbi:MAG: hypothetical protein ABIS50_12635 [Luteolibacter sp.]|uniref:hypothetical protein n=1 Tax=Luteolibacter sp. TaxID=1962973 RepID=UPI003265BBB0
MPRSPLTLALGLAIVAGFFIFLLWPGQELQEWGLYAAMSLPVIIGLFTWCAVRDAPPLDDQAFHRTLPPGDGHAFRKVLAMHGWVLLGIALSEVIYCWIYNFGWPVMSYGLLILTLPVWGLMGALGVASSLATSRQFGKTWGYAAVFGLPLVSAAIPYHLRDGFRPEEYAGDQYFNSHRMIVLVATVLYPMIWWLAAVRRRNVTALCLSAVIGALIPVIHVYGGFFNASEVSAPEQPEVPRVSIERKFVPPGDDRWIPIESMISVGGLRDGEIIQLGRMGADSRYIRFYGVPDDERLREEGLFNAYSLKASMENGQITWGEAAVWRQLQKQLPGLETLDYLGGGMDVPMHVSTLRPGETALIRQRGERSNLKPQSFEQKVTEEDLNSAMWGSIGASVYKFEKVGVVKVANGGDIRLPQGGLLRIDPLAREKGHISIRMENFQQAMVDADGPWFGIKGEEQFWPGQPWLVAVDSSGKHAFALSEFFYENGRRSLLGRVIVCGFQAEDVSETENLARIEMLRGCSLHVFFPKVEGQFLQSLPPPR